MAKKEIKEKPIELTLWEAANKLRGGVDSAEYKHVVLGLVFLKFASDKFEEHRAKLIAEGKEKYLEMEAFYAKDNVFYLEEESRWNFIIKKKNQSSAGLPLLIDTALHLIEKDNKALKGALPDNYYSRLGLDTSKLSSLIDEINKVNTLKDKEQDIIGRVYEYFLGKFAIAEGKGKGEFYTPKTIVKLIAEMIEPYKGIIYDPACGSGGMFVQSVKFIESHHGNKKEVSIYGQESSPTTFKLAKMNLAIRGISANLGEKHADTFLNDQHKDLKADFVMANPPFNQKDWRAANELLDDPRWRGFDVPPKSNANYGWILNMVSKLSDNGVAGFILANGSLGGNGEEYKIRRKLIENNLVEAVVIIPRDTFYTTDISVTLWIINKNKKARTAEVNGRMKNYREREKEILFMDLRRWGVAFEKQFIELTDEEIAKVAENYHNWQQSDWQTSYKNIPEFCYSANFEQIQANDYSLVPSKYIEFIDRDGNIDFDNEMKRIQKDFQILLQEEEQSQLELQNAAKNLDNLLTVCNDYVDSLQTSDNKMPIGRLVKLVDNRNKDNTIDNLLGINVDKTFMPSKANVSETDLSKYKIIQKEQFAYSAMQVGRDETVRVVLYPYDAPAIISPAYLVFEVIDKNIVLPEFLMLWYYRPEFNRYGWFISDSSVRASLDWDRFCEIEIPIPNIEVQEDIVTIYKATENRKRINEILKNTLEPLYPVLMRGVIKSTSNMKK